ncbi:MAG TPA: glycosyltransferase family 39 protein [Planctomycetaceae bacterium]|nr:glycosyltransferase family 39 protein [Planctomycetaceae bacterium]
MPASAPAPALPRLSRWSALPDWSIAALMGLAAWMLVAVALDPAGDYPRSPMGPGLTVDEIYNVLPGVELCDRMLAGDLAGMERVESGLHDHPPLGRAAIGVFHETGLLWSPPQGEHAALVVACARLASAFEFGLLIALITWFAQRWEGRTAGIVAGISVILMPRVFGHAHIAALETPMMLTCVAVVLVAADRWGDISPPTWRSAILLGVLWGLALLAKIQAILLPIPIALWVLFVWRRRAVLPLVMVGVIGLCVFLAGWMWLWGDPLGRSREFFASTTERAVIWVTYFGQKYADRALPWHYPWVLFLITLPVGLLALGIWGTIANAPTRRGALLLAVLLFTLCVFSVPGVAVYDGVRLFVYVFPLWGIFAGIGAQRLFMTLRSRLTAAVAALPVIILLICQAWGCFAYAPCWLSYFNVLTGGVAGAERWGLETTYWSDSVTRELLERTAELAPRGSVVEFAPVLHHLQLPALESQCPALREKEIRLQAWSGEARSGALVLSFPRRAYLPENWTPAPPRGRVLAEVVRGGVRLAALYEIE